ncbi:hypothetical protein Trydic_g11645 [Trypoxylus dichotomus]
MDLPDRRILICDDSDCNDSPARESDIEEMDEEEDVKTEREGFQEFLSKIRLYNREGPHVIYRQNSELERKVKEPRRLIRKSGKYNVSRHVESQIWDKYLRDLCNTLVHSRWRWTIIAASSSFVLSWLLFGVIWMLISNANGDAELVKNELKCISGVQRFGGYFMLSLETQTTIGYGTRSLNDQCPEVVFIVCLQIILGVAICGLTINIVYIKMTKSQNIYSRLFSKHAVISRRDGDLCLIFRVRDEDSRHAIGTTITAYILRKDRETGEPYLENIPLEPYGFLIWPLEIVHKITPTSPLWDVSSYNLLSDKFEIIVTLQGTSPTTAQCSRTRTSYISSEILWGHKFKNCNRFVRNLKKYVVNQKFFNKTEEHSTHLCSAKRFAEVYDSLSPTAGTPKNCHFKVNIMYNTNQRRGTVVSIETVDGSNKIEEQSMKSVQDAQNKTMEDRNNEKETKLEDIKNRSTIERPSTLSLPPVTKHYPDNYEKNWDYQNYSEYHIPDFWLKEAASLPLINNYNQDRTLKSRKFGSELQNLRMSSLYTPTRNLTDSKNFFNSPRVFEDEELYDNRPSVEESSASLFSADYRRSDLSIDHDRELEAMLKGMESYLERNSIDSRSVNISEGVHIQMATYAYKWPGNNGGAASSISTDSDRIEVVSDEIPQQNTSQPTTEPTSESQKEIRRRERRHHHRPYAASSNRIVQKCGRNNVISTEVPQKNFRYFKDIGNTLLNTRWRWILISLCAANAVAYIVFAGFWMLLAVINDDNDEDRRGDFPPCIYGANSFTGYLLLSITTVSTIGYGMQYPTECQPSWMILTLQALTNVAIEGALVTAVFVKMSKPSNKNLIRMFSRKAVISMRDGVLCLIFRIRDINGKHWARTMIKAVLIKRRNSPEGEPLAYYFENLKLEKHGLMIWPLEVVHKITYESPLWTVSPQILYKCRFEIMIILEGDSITTGQSSQSQTSYMNKEICWGYRFVPCVSYDKEEHKYVIDDDKFNEITECDTPLCSAQELSGLLDEATRPPEQFWDSHSLLSTPTSRRSESSMGSTHFRFSSFRLKKDIDGLPSDRGTYNRQFSGATLETINSVENLLASNISLNDEKRELAEKRLLSTNL